ncbi:MAG TPA: hypothetical protein DDX39_12870 [Bacteroidales bacterium]|nr:MAG: hypothetical protein A2W98_02605 [Bacteroidetes bacterium GWF2_33_38]OFY73197.1 MAG: hypothetical protein A2265_04570 [Bacteroidetes bacterium RIFOXYA12_FULL_33_9]HBF89524.1 hypothetical protein [Bacteroidales bacterium]
MKTNIFYIIFLSIFIVGSNIYGQTNWTKYSNNPVITKGPDNFDMIAIGQPTTLFENDTIKMWYAGVSINDAKARICYAYSLDGINWTKHTNSVIEVGTAGEWDCGWLDTPEIVKDNSGYKMYYYGDTVQQFAAISSAIGLATSIDGIHWEKHPDNPIFTKANFGDWDGSWVESPTVFFDSVANEYKMWYNGVDTATWKIQIGLATSSDGVTWVRNPANPVVTTSNWGGYDDIWLGTPTVIKPDSLFEMWYAATSTDSYNSVTQSFDTVSICYATSVDGIVWNKHQNNPLFHTYTEPYDSLIDRGGPWAPCVIFNQNTNEYMMWFEAHGGVSNYNFSLATSPKTATFIDKKHPQNNILLVYPNPMETTSIIKANKLIVNGTLIILNLIGEVVCKQTNINALEIKISKENLPSGIYTFYLTNDEMTEVGKFIIQ